MDSHSGNCSITHTNIHVRYNTSTHTITTIPIPPPPVVGTNTWTNTWAHTDLSLISTLYKEYLQFPPQKVFTDSVMRSVCTADHELHCDMTWSFPTPLVKLAWGYAVQKCFVNNVNILPLCTAIIVDSKWCCYYVKWHRIDSHSFTHNTI